MRISDWSSDVCSSDLLGVIKTEHRGAIKEHILDELDEGGLDRVEAAIMVEMFRIEVGDDRDRAVEAQEAAVALVALDHPPVQPSEPSVRSVIVDDPTVDGGRVEPARNE